MKKIIILLFIMLCGTVCAQTYDTVSGRNGILPQYYYPEGWFDTCDVYYRTTNSPERFPNNPEKWGSLIVLGDLSGVVTPPNMNMAYRFTTYAYHVEEPVAFTGVAVMVTDLPEDTLPILIDSVFADTVYIFCPDTSGELAVVGAVSTRWDTAARKVWKFPINVDSAVYGFRYVYLYDLKFDHPVVVDSIYYISGTFYNSYHFTPDGLHDYHLSAHSYLRAVIFDRDFVFYMDTPCNLYKEDSYISYPGKDGLEIYMVDNYGSLVDWWGPYLLMIDSCTIEVESADSAMGTAGPTRSMSKWVTQTITATPEYGYLFSHWDDGNTDNPRDVYLTQDTHLTAYFERTPRHMVQTRCVPEGMGLVRGGGQYWSGDTVTLTATGAIAPYIFHEWNDGSQENPRRFVIEQDTLFTAYFGYEFEGIDTLADAEALFTLTPNPTTGDCLLETRGGLPSHANCRVSVTDAQGREVLRRELKAGMRTLTLDVSNLPAGTYFVTLTTKEGTSTRKLVVE